MVFIPILKWWRFDQFDAFAALTLESDEGKNRTYHAVKSEKFVSPQRILAQFIRSAKVNISTTYAYFSILKLAYATLK